ncbi:hypothetical protein [Niabella beijingensis]|uniref:hypothetical protein n=1 Tax=Niabella beijingensis TaxID=2872700 RepID=UPI001CBFABED|nr:hypothetical protein [Niabella beijingensis]MBZ4190321.1 hypothetical protein [Niabella beijingensis]
MNNTSHYPEFEYAAPTLNKFIEASGIFTILLTSGAIIHFRPENSASFRQWLTEHAVEDIRSATTAVTS